MIKFTNLQLKLLADFFANLAVVWFGTAFINVPQTPLGSKSFATGFLSLLIGMIIAREVKEK